MYVYVYIYTHTHTHRSVLRKSSMPKDISLEDMAHATDTYIHTQSIEIHVCMYFCM